MTAERQPPRPGELFSGLSHLVERILPSETVTHLRAARREQLLAVRSVIDAALTRIETAEATRAARPNRVERTEISVE